jgi:hypothetical protein
MFELLRHLLAESLQPCRGALGLCVVCVRQHKAVGARYGAFASGGFAASAATLALCNAPYCASAKTSGERPQPWNPPTPPVLAELEDTSAFRPRLAHY